MKMEVVIFDMHKSMFALFAFQCQFNKLISAKLTFILFKVKFCMSLVISHFWAFTSKLQIIIILLGVFLVYISLEIKVSCYKQIVIILLDGFLVCDNYFLLGGITNTCRFNCFVIDLSVLQVSTTNYNMICWNELILTC